MAVRSNTKGGPPADCGNNYRNAKHFDTKAADFAKNNNISKRQARKVLQGRKTLAQAQENA